MTVWRIRWAAGNLGRPPRSTRMFRRPEQQDHRPVVEPLRLHAPHPLGKDPVPVLVDPRQNRARFGVIQWCSGPYRPGADLLETVVGGFGLRVGREADQRRAWTVRFCRGVESAGVVRGVQLSRRKYPPGLSLPATGARLAGWLISRLNDGFITTPYRGQSSGGRQEGRRRPSVSRPILDRFFRWQPRR